jgi:hypothetical protein
MQDPRARATSTIDGRGAAPDNPVRHFDERGSDFRKISHAEASFGPIQPSSRIVMSRLPFCTSGPHRARAPIAPQRAVVHASDQTPTVAALSSVEGESIVVTPYFLFDPKRENMALLHQCISRDAQRLAAALDGKR